MAQGQKVVSLEDERYVYDPLHYLVASVTLPVTGQVTLASPEQPYLSLRLDIDPTQLSSLIADAGPMGVPSQPSSRGVFIERLDTQMLDALLRLIRLLDTPKDIAVLAPLIRREILYRLLRGQQGFLPRSRWVWSHPCHGYAARCGRPLLHVDCMMMAWCGDVGGWSCCLVGSSSDEGVR